jgi:pseudaminic acid biosynthesis-associated methylase
MKTTDFWAGQFGTEYTQRNRVDWKNRVPFWESAIQFCQPATALEVGCNAGWNMRAIQQVDQSIEIQGVDINPLAAEEARQAGLDVNVIPADGILGMFEAGSMDLVFTCGVLIHIAPEDLELVMRNIVTISGRFVLAVEYHNETEEEVEYRGHAGKLWKRDYGKLYQNLGLNLLSVGDAGGFDSCQYYLLEKKQ